MTKREQFEIKMLAQHDQRVAEAADELDALDNREQTLMLFGLMNQKLDAATPKERLIARMAVLGMWECLMANHRKALQ